MTTLKKEPLVKFSIFVSDEHTFGTDAVLLADIAVAWYFIFKYLWRAAPFDERERILSYGEDYTEGLLEDVDLESYRAEAQQTMRIQLENENGKIDPIPVSTSVGIDVPELDTLTNILKEFHDIFGNIEWTDEDKIKKQINDIIESVRRDEKYNNAMQFSDKQNARDESDRAAHEAVMNSMQSGLELFREVQNNPSFRKWLFDSAFNSTYQANHNQTSL